MNHTMNNNLNKYDFYDYKKPLTFKETDYRTATVRGHQFYFPKEAPTRRAVTTVHDARKPIVIKNVTETSEEFPFKVNYIKFMHFHTIFCHFSFLSNTKHALLIAFINQIAQSLSNISMKKFVKTCQSQ